MFHKSAFLADLEKIHPCRKIYKLLNFNRGMQKIIDIQEILHGFEGSLFLQSRLELEAYARRHSSIATGWGYFPAIPENEPENYPNTHLLANKIKQIAVNNMA